MRRNSDEIKVKVHSYGQGRALSLVYFDPTSGKKVAKSSGTTNEREAERLAGELEKQLRVGLNACPSRITWAEFRHRYEDDQRGRLAPATMITVRDALDHLERIKNPDKPAKVTTAVLNEVQTKLRKDRGVREATIAKIMRHIRAALNWGERNGLLTKAPKVEMPRKARGERLARSRAVTLEELERMLQAAEKVRPADFCEWQRLLWALWLGGFRRAEAVAMSWDEDAPFAIDLSGRRPRLRILGEAQKSGDDQYWPMPPDLWQWLDATYPPAERHGNVFHLVDQRSKKPLLAHHVGVVVTRIARRAGVVTNKADGKFAGCHDLRRAFCTRWAKKVSPAILQRLARHSDYKTTADYYVDIDADDLADELWDKHTPNRGEIGALGNKSGNIGQEGAEHATSPAAANDCRA